MVQEGGEGGLRSIDRVLWKQLRKKSILIQVCLRGGGSTSESEDGLRVTAEGGTRKEDKVGERPRLCRGWGSKEREDLYGTE